MAKNTLNYNIELSEIEKYSFLPNGILKINKATIAHIGELKYPEEINYVDNDTLFEKGHLRSLEGACLTIEHPDEPITPFNYKRYSVGHLLALEEDKEKGLLNSSLIIGDYNAIDKVVNHGFRFVSEAYYTKRVNINGKIYQRHRKTNHVALTDRPRAKQAKIFLDSTKQNNLVEKDEILKQFSKVISLSINY